MGVVALVHPKGGHSPQKKAPKKNPRPAAAAGAKKPKKPRHNPIGSMLKTRSGGIGASIVRAAAASAAGAAGMAAMDLALRFAPVSVKTGAMSHVTKAGAAIAVGLLGRKHPVVSQAAQGALTIVLYQALRQYVTVPMNLGEISDSDMQQLAETYGDGMGVYDVAQPALGVNTPALGVYEGQMADAYDMAP